MTTEPSATDLVAVENKVPEIVSEITNCTEEGKKPRGGNDECHLFFFFFFNKEKIIMNYRVLSNFKRFSQVQFVSQIVKM